MTLRDRTASGNSLTNTEHKNVMHNRLSAE